MLVGASSFLPARSPGPGTAPDPVDEYATYQAIRRYCGTKRHEEAAPPEPLGYPATVSEAARGFIDALLQRGPEERLGAGLTAVEPALGSEALRTHPFLVNTGEG